LSISMLTGDVDHINTVLLDHGIDINQLALNLGLLLKKEEEEKAEAKKTQGKAAKVKDVLYTKITLGGVSLYNPGIIDISMLGSYLTASVMAGSVVYSEAGLGRLLNDQPSLSFWMTAGSYGLLSIVSNTLPTVFVHETIHYLSKSLDHANFVKIKQLDT